MTTIDTAPPVAANGIPLLDPDPPRVGPASRRLLARLGIGLLLVEALGAWLTFAVATDGARAAGLSLVVPGGGFLYLARPLAFAVTAALAVIALVLWWGLSFHLAIPAVWAGSALAAWALVEGPRLVIDEGTTWGWAVPASYLLALAVVGAAVGKFERRFRAKRDRITELNEYLATVEVSDPVAEWRRPDAMDAECLRWCYELAHQDEDGLRGLDWGEQFHGGTQLRYQLNAHCWALSMYAANNLPNAPAQITEALARLVHKHTDLRVWRYWRTLNLLGNFDASPDPIVRDNIMFSAFLGDVLNTFEAATGDHRFDEPGSLTFVWKDGRTFAYDHHTIVDAVHDNYERSSLGFYPCEPGWSFTVCNVMGAQSMHGHDVLHGTDLWDRNRDRWRQTLEDEYLTPDGTYAHIRSNHVGLSWDTGEVPDGHYTANGTGRFADILPAHGRRARALDLRKAGPAMAGLAAMVDEDGRLPLEMPAELERHRTASSHLPGWTKVLAGARMVGDDRLAEAAMAGAADQCATGDRWPQRPLAAGSSAFGGHLIVRWSSPIGLAELHQRGFVAPTGPVLADTSWDDVVVLVARSPDGVTLDLELEPWGDAPVTTTLHLSRLRPGTTYRVGSTTGDTTVVADRDGTAAAPVTIAGRTQVTVTPAVAS